MRVRTVNIRCRPGNRTQGLIEAGGAVFRCALGRSGVTGSKHEGDGATPRGPLPVLYGFWRPDRVRRPQTALGLVAIGAGMGWCDAPADRNYNRPVPLPYPASHEEMRRQDGLYDMGAVLDWNVTQRRRGAGSAIFLHIARPGFRPTEGCIAVEEKTMRRLLSLIGPGTVFNVLG